MLKRYSTVEIGSQMSKFSVATITLNPAIDRIIMLEDFAMNKVNKISNFTDHMAGKGINVAKVLSQFQVKCYVSGFLGRENEWRFRQYFKELNLHDHFISIEGENRTNIKITSQNDHVTDINFSTLTANDKQVDEILQIISTLDVDYVVVSGSPPQGLSNDIYAHMIDHIQKSGKKVILDVSGIHLKEALKAKPFCIKPNIHELEEICGKSLKNHEDIGSIAKEIVDMGIQQVIVSLGEDGALFVDKDQFLHAKPPKQKLVSTVGAGDSFVAAWLIEWLKEKTPMEALLFATAVSAHSVSHISVGIEEGFSHKDLQDLIENTQCLINEMEK